MSPFTSLLVPLNGSRAAAASLGSVAWLASRLNARLHILSSTNNPLPVREELARLRVPESYWPLIILHQAPKFPEEAILAAAEELDADLIAMSASGESVEKARTQAPEAFGAFGHVTRAVIEQSRAPVLLLPVSYHEDLPWRHVLVPVSGEPETDDALTLAVSLSNALNLDVHVAHVMNRGTRGRGLAAAAHYADALHHEYPQQLAELVCRNLPQPTTEECLCITNVSLVRGEIASELLKLMGEEHISLIVVGWHGHFMAGHAKVLKELLPVVTCPILLVKPPRRHPFKLKVGSEIEQQKSTTRVACACPRRMPAALGGQFAKVVTIAPTGA
jgi:nucleotide-binding universal stress UspA family protein